MVLIHWDLEIPISMAFSLLSIGVVYWSRGQSNLKEDLFHTFPHNGVGRLVYRVFSFFFFLFFSSLRGSKDLGQFIVLFPLYPVHALFLSG